MKPEPESQFPGEEEDDVPFSRSTSMISLIGNLEMADTSYVGIARHAAEARFASQPLVQ